MNRPDCWVGLGIVPAIGGGVAFLTAIVLGVGMGVLAYLKKAKKARFNSVQITMEEDSGISMPQKRQTVVTDDPKITTGDHDKFNPGGPSLMSEGITVNEETMKAEDA